MTAGEAGDCWRCYRAHVLWVWGYTLGKADLKGKMCRNVAVFASLKVTSYKQEAEGIFPEQFSLDLKCKNKIVV